MIMITLDCDYQFLFGRLILKCLRRCTMKKLLIYFIFYCMISSENINGYRHSNCSMVHFYILGGAHSNLSKLSRTYSKLLPSRTVFSFLETSKTFLRCFYKLLRSSIGIFIDFSELPRFFCVQNLPQVVLSSHGGFFRCFYQVYKLSKEYRPCSINRRQDRGTPQSSQHKLWSFHSNILFPVSQLPLILNETLFPFFSTISPLSVGLLFCIRQTNSPYRS